MSIVDNVSQEQEISSKNWKALEGQINKITNPFDEDLDLKNSNANVNGLSPMGKMLQYGTEASKIYALKNLVNKKAAKAHIDGDIHIHDLDFHATKTTTCNQIPLGEMLKNGIWNEHGYIRPPKSIGTAGQLAAVVLQSHQNMQHGGQSFSNFDFDLAPYVKISFEKNKKFLKDIFGFMRTTKLNEKAWKLTEKETLQAMEGLVHNINTMHSRSGAQVVFASINFGLDTSKEGRLVSKCLMQAQSNGLGHGETPIFPILCFKVKEGINYNPEDPNYDLFKMSLEVTAKRLFPNWVFEDAPFNLALYNDKEPQNAISAMGCRTRLATSVFPESHGTSNKRGNISFTSINLPRLGILANGDKEKFFTLLKEKLDLVHDQLLERYKYQITAKPEEFLYMVKNNTMVGADKFLETGNAEEMVKHGSLSIGFIGLAECLKALIGKHHGESKEAQELGLEIVGFMRDYCDEKAKEETLNWSLLATPAEGLAGRFTKLDKEKFGVIKGVTDRDFYTNSSHCFSGDTIVQTEDGYKEIRHIRPGDKVITKNEKTGDLEIDTVEWAGKTKDSDKLAIVEFTNGQMELCTPDHPFAKRAFEKGTEYIEWTKAENLSPLDRIESNYQETELEDYYGYIYKLTSSEGHTYIGCHKGKVNDGYITSSRFYKRRLDLDWQKEIVKLCQDEYSMSIWETVLILRDKQENNKNVNGNRGKGYDDQNRGFGFFVDSWSSLTDEEKQDRIARQKAASKKTSGYEHGFQNPEVQKKCREGLRKFYDSMDDGERYIYQLDKTHKLQETLRSKPESFFKERSKKMKESRARFFANGGKVWNKREDINYEVVAKLYVEGNSKEEIAKILQCSPALINKIFFENGGCKLLRKNHQIKSVTIVDFSIPVYDIKMSKNHNFFVGREDGVLVHNCPVYYNISAFEKIDIEAPYHALENAGHIAYIELDGDATKNIEALESIVRHMKEKGIGYGSINHPVDKCRNCGHAGVIGKECPVCGSKDIERLRRITGYLVGSLERWNPGKKAEEASRVKHEI